MFASHDASGSPAKDPYFNSVALLLHGDSLSNNAVFTPYNSSGAISGMTVSPVGSVEQGSFNPFGGNYYSAYFDASSCFTVPDSASVEVGSSDFTIECWVYPTSTTSQAIFSKRPNTTTPSSITLQINSLALTLNASFDGATWAVTITTSAINGYQWSHVAVTRSGSTWTVWVNGANAGTATASGTVNDNTTAFTIGARTATAGGPFSGFISNFRMVKGTSIYNSAFTVPTSPLTAIANTTLLTLQNNRVIDNSSNNATITAVGGFPNIYPETPFLIQKPYFPTNGGSIYFPGSASNINNSTQVFSQSGDFTFEMWVLPTNTGTVQTCFGKTSNLEIRITAANRLYFGYLPVSGTYTSVTGTTTSIIEGQWNHIAVTRSSGTIRLFVNGVVDATTLSSSGDIGFTGCFWGAISTGSQMFAGYISSFVWRNVASYTANFTLPTAPPTTTNAVLLLNFNEGGIFDNAMKVNFVSNSTAVYSSSTQKKYGPGSIYFPNTNNLTSHQKFDQYFYTNPFTVEFWVYYLSISSSATNPVINRSTTGSDGYLLTVNTSSQVALNWSTASTITTTTTLSPNTWYHIALVRSGTGSNQTAIYINGVSSATGTFGFSVTSGTLYLNDTRTQASKSNMYLDELRVTKNVARYTGNFTPPTTFFPNQ